MFHVSPPPFKMQTASSLHVSSGLFNGSQAQFDATICNRDSTVSLLQKKKKARESEEKMLLAAQSLEEVLIPQRTAKCRRKLAGSKITLRSRKFQSQLRERKERMTPNAAGCDSDVATVKDREGAPI